MIKLFFALCSIALVGCAAGRFTPYNKTNKLELNNVVRNIEYKKDTFKKAVFLTPIKRSSKGPSIIKQPDRVSIQPYMSANFKGNTSLRLIIELDKEGWLFMNKVHFMCGDSELVVEMPRGKVSRDVIYGASISERFDSSMSLKDFNYLKKCKVGDAFRTSGNKYYIDSKIQPEEVGYFQEVELILSEFKKNGYEKTIKQFESRAAGSRD